MNSTRFEINEEIKSRQKIIDQCNQVISESKVKIHSKWIEIKDFVDGNSSERVAEGAAYIEREKRYIRDRMTEIGRKQAQIDNYRAMLSFREG